MYQEVSSAPEYEVAAMYRAGQLKGRDYEDCLQEARLAAWVATGTFDPKRSKLSSWVSSRSRWAAIDFIRRQGPLGIKRQLSDPIRAEVVRKFNQYQIDRSVIDPRQSMSDKDRIQDKIELVRGLLTSDLLGSTDKRIIESMLSGVCAAQAARAMGLSSVRGPQCVKKIRALAAKRMKWRKGGVQ